LRRALKILLKAHLSSKTILFIGAPTGLEKEFSLLCRQHKHSFMEKVPFGFFTNYKNKIYPGFSKSIQISQRPHLIFLFNPSLDAMVFAELKALDIPVIGFISSDDDYSLIDYPIPANTRSQKGGLFVYNLFYHLFSAKELKYVKKKVSSERKLTKTSKALS
jgi:ribosomal protein S2